MEIYQSKFERLPGTRYKEVYDKAFAYYSKIKKRTKRQPYVRSKYFGKQKVFLNLFWRHLDQKDWRDRARRLRLFMAGIDLLRNTKLNPQSKENPNKRSEIQHRFYGVTKCGNKFAVQIKENKRSGRRFLISIFPYK